MKTFRVEHIGAISSQSLRKKERPLVLHSEGPELHPGRLDIGSI
jgi:hypothetical protein